MQRGAILVCAIALMSACTVGDDDASDAGQDGTGSGGAADATMGDGGSTGGNATGGMQDGSSNGTDSNGTDSDGTDSNGTDGTDGDATDSGDSSGAGVTTGTSTTDDGSTSGDTDGSTGDESGSSTGAQQYSDDPFDPQACFGTAWSVEDAAAALGGLERLELANATIQVRTRTCPGGVCGEWGEPDDWTISYLTWSGGVVTAYKDFLTDMNFVLFDDEGTPRLSMQHVTFPTGGYPDTDGVVYDLPPSVVDFAHLRAYDDDPDFEYYYQDLDYLVTDATLILGDDCAVWTANPYGTGEPFLEQYAAVFHW